MAQPTPRFFMRVSVSKDASLRWAIDQRSGAIDIWTFTWSNTSSSRPTEASLPQCTVSVRPRCAAQSAIASKASLSAAVGLSLLYMPPVIRAPDFEQRLVIRRRDVVAARVDDARQSEAVQFEEELLRALDFLLVGGL